MSTPEDSDGFFVLIVALLPSSFGLEVVNDALSEAIAGAGAGDLPLTVEEDVVTFVNSLVP